MYMYTIIRLLSRGCGLVPCVLGLCSLFPDLTPDRSLSFLFYFQPVYAHQVSIILAVSCIYRSLLPMEDTTVQWAVAISLLIALVTLMIHALLCYLTRRWAYMSVSRSQELVAPSNMISQKKRKKLKRRKPRPKFRAPLMLHYTSSTDCSL